MDRVATSEVFQNRLFLYSTFTSHFVGSKCQLQHSLLRSRPRSPCQTCSMIRLSKTYRTTSCLSIESECESRSQCGSENFLQGVESTHFPATGHHHQQRQVVGHWCSHASVQCSPLAVHFVNSPTPQYALTTMNVSTCQLTEVPARLVKSLNIPKVWQWCVHDRSTC